MVAGPLTGVVLPPLRAELLERLVEDLGFLIEIAGAPRTPDDYVAEHLRSRCLRLVRDFSALGGR